MHGLKEIKCKVDIISLSAACKRAVCTCFSQVTVTLFIFACSLFHSFVIENLFADF